MNVILIDRLWKSRAEILYFFFILFFQNGGLAQLARAPALHAGGHRFDSDILHKGFVFYKPYVH